MMNKREHKKWEQVGKKVDFNLLNLKAHFLTENRGLKDEEIKGK